MQQYAVSFASAVFLVALLFTQFQCSVLPPGSRSDHRAADEPQQSVAPETVAIETHSATDAAPPAPEASPDNSPLAKGVVITLDEPSQRPTLPVVWPVTVGVPFAATGLFDPNLLAVTADGAAIPRQMQEAARYRDGSLRWAHLDFQLPLAAGKYPNVEFGKHVAPASVASAKLRVSESADLLTVDSGSMTLRVDKVACSISWQASDSAQVPEQLSIYHVDSSGAVLDNNSASQCQTRLESTGPLKAVVKVDGWFATRPTTGSTTPAHRRLQFSLRFSMFNDLPYLRLYHTFVWTEPDTYRLRDLGIKISRNRTPARLVFGHESGANTSVDVPKAAHVAQLTYSNAPTYVGVSNGSTARLAGWAVVQNSDETLAVAMRDMAMQVPKGFSTKDNVFSIHLWDPLRGELTMREIDRAPPVAFTNGQLNYNAEWVPFSGPADPLGVAKTHEIWLMLLRGDPATTAATAQALNDYVQRPVVAMADANYQLATRAMAAFLSNPKDTPPAYQPVETAIDAIFEQVTFRDDRALGDFEMFNFGDVHLFGFSSWRYFDNGGYNWPEIPWLLFYRSGHRKYLVEGERNARHVMDVDVCHFEEPDFDERDPYSKRPGKTYAYAPLHWAWGAANDTFWTHPRYLQYYYYLTGYERAKDVLLAMAENSKTTLTAPNVNNVNLDRVSREQYGVIEPKLVYFDFTGDQRFLVDAIGWKEVTLAAVARHGSLTHNAFMGFFLQSLDHVGLVNGDQRVRALLQQMAQPYVNTNVTPSTRALTWATHDDRLASDQGAPYAQRNAHFSLWPLLASYLETGDARFLRYPASYVQGLAQMVQDAGPPRLLGGRGYHGNPRLWSALYIKNSLQTLTALANVGFPQLQAWPANLPQFASNSNLFGDGKSGMRIYIRKQSAQAGSVNFYPKVSNLSAAEAVNGNFGALTVRAAGPNGWSRNFLLTGAHSLALGPNDPPGVYRFDVSGSQRMFYLAASSDLAGLVFEQFDSRIRVNGFEGFERVFFKSVKNALTISSPAEGVQSLIPARVETPDGKTCLKLDSPATRPVNPSSTLVSGVFSKCPGADDGLFALRIPYHEGEANPGLEPYVLVDGLIPFVAPSAGEWFDPRGPN